MSAPLAEIPRFPLSKRQTIIYANVLFWLFLMIYDALTIGGILNGYYEFALFRAFLHLFFLAGMVYTNLYFLYPRFFSRGQYFYYIPLAILLIAGTTVARIYFDSFFLSLDTVEKYLTWLFTWEEALAAIGDMQEAGFLSEDYRFTASFKLGMTLGTLGVFVLTAPFKLVEDWYEKQRLRVQLLEDELARQEVALELKTTEIRLQEEKIKFLRAQTDPHFLLNALSSVYHLSLLQSDKIDVAILRLSELMSYLLGHGKKDRIPLKYEIEFIRNYIEFHKTIHPEPVQVSFEHTLNATQLDALEIPPMLIQPFFENAFKYGDWDEAADGWIKSQLRVEGRQLFFTIENTVAAAEPGNGKPSYHVGLQNVRERLAINFPDGHQLRLIPEGRLFRVELRVDLG